jgi:hypothetical protein
LTPSVILALTLGDRGRTDAQHLSLQQTLH